MSNVLNRLYLKDGNVPRNYIPPEIEPGMDRGEVRKLYFEANGQAFKKSQRELALGIIAAGSVIANIVNPPEDIADVARNVAPLMIMQTLTYMSFRTGLGLMKERLQDDLFNDSKILE